MNISIGRKLMMIIMVTCIIALSFACAAFATYEYFTFRREIVNNLSALAKITARNNTAALVFDDSVSAQSTLSALSVEKHIVSAYIYNKDGDVFARYTRDDFSEKFLSPVPEEFGSSFKNGYLETYEPIILDNEEVGTIYIRSELKVLYSRLKQYGIIAILIMVTAIAVAFPLSIRLQRSISKPILSLVELVKVVSEKKDYSVRVKEQKQKEFAILTKAFNEMLSRIQIHDLILQKAHDNLDLKVKERTEDLQNQITERKLAQDELVNYQKKLVTVLDTVGEGIITIDSNGSIIMVNRELCNIFGFSQDEIIGKNLQILMPEKYRKAHFEGLRLFVKTRKPKIIGQQLELEGLKKDGTIFPIEICITESKIGENLFFTAALRDITDRKKNEEDLFRLMTAIEQSAESIIITDIEGTIQYVNPSFSRITGFDKEEAIGKTPRILNSGKQSATFYKELWDKITQGDVWEGHFVNKRKDGTLYEEDTSISSVKDTSGKIVNYVAVKRDVTHEVELENQLHQALKMEAIGKLAGGIAHDFNNILGGILGYASLLKLKASNDEGVFRIADSIEKASNRAADLTQQLLGFARKGKFKNIEVDVDDIILEVMALAKRTFDKKIVITHEPRVEKATILGDPNQIHQVLLNLSINARDAMPNGGNLIFSTDTVELDEEYCKIYTYTLPGKYLCISIADTGCGIPNEIHDRIFEPFFTTKEPGKGTGMGLAMIYGIVKNHNGIITVDSEVGNGTTFKLYLPFSFGTTAKKMEDKEKGLTKGKGRILIVDDEELMRDTLSAMFSHIGYEVVTAVDGQDAVDYYKKFWKNIDLVIMDLIMPRLGGYESFKIFKEINPDVKVILSTGHDENDETQKMINEGVMDFIQKPYVINDLSRVVAKTLGNGKE